jgi:hypothetical protein
MSLHSGTIYLIIIKMTTDARQEEEIKAGLGSESAKEEDLPGTRHCSLFLL